MKSVIFLIGLIFISANLLISCSSTTSYSRYKTTKKEPDTENYSVRYGKKKKTKEKSYKNPESGESKDIVSVKEFREKLGKIKKLNGALTDRERLLFEIVKYLDTPYKYGGQSQKGIDCSAFTQQVYKKSLGVLLPRTAREQYKVGDKVSDLKFGDLVYFDTQQGVFPGHVGIYLGDSLFAHASSIQGVTITPLNNKYFKKRYIGARRITSIDK